MRDSLLDEVDKEYQSRRYKQNDQRITFEQYQEMKQQITYDIAWQIFDEVNQNNVTEKYIDLNCLEATDAQAITKQQIYDVALIAREQYQAQNSNAGGFNMSQGSKMNQFSNGSQSQFGAKQNNLVICIQCGDNHLVQLQ